MNNINFADEIQEWITSSLANKKNDNDTFGSKWNHLGDVIRSSVTNSQAIETITSFNALSLNDFVKIIPNAYPDQNNFWCSPLFPTCKFTTFAHLGGEQGFYTHASHLKKITIIAFETYDLIQPKMICHEDCRLIVLPYVQSPFVMFFFISSFIDPINVNVNVNTIVNSNVNVNVNTITNTNMNTNVTELNVDSLLEKWKIEKPNLKPTIPKVSDFANIEQDKIHKWLKNNGKSWSNMLVTHGFR
jgi:hypothetical protein